MGLFLLIVLAATRFAGAAEHDQPFRRALPGYEFRFPADHAAHPDFRTEWWYYTGHLSTAQGRTFGFQLTFFRHALRRPDETRRSRWALYTLYFAHFAVTDEEGGTFRFQEKVSRGSLGLAGAETGRYLVWVEDWSARVEGQSHRLMAGREDMGLDLTLVPSKRPSIHGRDGLSQKAEGEGYASYYYSITRLTVSGTLSWQGHSYPVTGEAWMDHEFGSNQLRDYQAGWDWFSVQLDRDVELMVYLIRHRDGRIDPTSSGTIIWPDGTANHLPLSALQVEVLDSWRSKKSGVTYPSGWRLKVPGYEVDLTLTPTLADQELTTQKSTLVNYWEGSVGITGTVAGKPVQGRGYVELTGYDKKFRPDI
ncbi:MAG TPA: lipocalin-like domain-containing protein [Syntrophobacteria bacterium]|nr:lipocalin-like domain-containing protein [Syntrophobacteria bacterium]